MSQPTGSIYEIRWNELCPWLILVKAWRVSLLVRVLAYAWLGLLLTQWGWSVCEELAGNSPPQLELLALRSGSTLTDVREQKDVEGRLAARSLFQVDPLPGTITVSPEDFDLAAWWHQHWRRHGLGPIVKGWSWLSSPFVLIFEQDATLVSAFFKLLCGLWAIAVWALFGGAIARIAACYLTREEIIGPVAAGRAALSKWPSTAGGPLLGLSFAGIITIPFAVVGLFLRWDFSAMFVGLLWVLMLACGVFFAIVVLALWFGWPLMWATIAVERSDAFDAAARTASYIYQRPVRLAFYIAVATLLGILGQLIVSGFVAGGIHLTDWAVSWGSGAERIAQLSGEPLPAVFAPTSEGSAAIAEQSIQFWKNMLAAVAAAYPLAFLFSTSVGIYLLLRLQIDSTEMDEIAADTGEEMGRMPELKENSWGVPLMVDDEPKDLSTRRNIEPGELAT